MCACAHGSEDRYWTLTKRLEKKLDGNYTRLLRAILNKSWRQHPTRHQLYGHLPPITKTIQVRRARHAGHCWRSKDELVSDVLWTPTYGQAKAGRPARTYIQQLCEDTGCNPEDLPEAMNDREKWREMVRDICAGGTTWWWWWSLTADWMCACVRGGGRNILSNQLSETLFCFLTQVFVLVILIHLICCSLAFPSPDSSSVCANSLRLLSAPHKYHRRKLKYNLIFLYTYVFLVVNNDTVHYTTVGEVDI